MSKIPYTNLKLKTDTSKSIIKFNDIEIEVLQYLPIEDKISLINVAVQKSREDGGFNPLKLKMYFFLNIIYMYTNITFTPKQREDESKLFDALMSNEIVDAVKEAMNEREFAFLKEMYFQVVAKEERKMNSIYGLIESFIYELPNKAEEAAEIIKNFDPNKFQEVIEFAKSANNGKLNFLTI